MPKYTVRIPEIFYVDVEVEVSEGTSTNEIREDAAVKYSKLLRPNEPEESPRTFQRVMTETMEDWEVSQKGS